MERMVAQITFESGQVAKRNNRETVATAPRPTTIRWADLTCGKMTQHQAKPGSSVALGTDVKRTAPKSWGNMLSVWGKRMASLVLARSSA
jgi:hypothetical protein